MNRLYYGDCLTIMQDMPLGSVDLIYLDPPFNSNQDYNAIYQDETGRPLPDQVEAFCDTWTLDEESERAIRQMPILLRDAGLDDEVAEFWRLWMNALRKTNPRLLAYLSYMVQRLLPMRSILKPTGSIYLHCDPTAAHYIKVMMDAIFRQENFRSEVIWKRSHAHNSARRWGPVHDTILFYSKTDKYRWNRTFQAYDQEYIDRYFKFDDGDGRGLYWTGDLTGAGVRNGPSGRPWRGHDVEVKGRHWAYAPDELNRLDQDNRIYWPKTKAAMPKLKRYLREAKGIPAQDILFDVPSLQRMSPSYKENLGYATQKPVALLERIISASSNPGDVVLDPFCGCATTIEAAHNLGRRWIGIDIAIHAVKRVAKVRLEDRLGLKEGVDFTIKGVPQNIEGARDLWTRDKYHFQKWAVEEVDGFVTTRRTGDGGIDGRLYFALPQQDAERRDPLRSMVLEVKGGRNVGIAIVRDLRGVLERDEAEMAGLIVMDEPGPTKRKNFGREMASAGDLEVFGVRYPRMQLLTVDEILEGKRFHTPSAVGRAIGQEALALSGEHAAMSPVDP